MTRAIVRMAIFLVAVGLALAPLTASGEEAASSAEEAQEILQAVDGRGGLIVHIGCGGGRLTAGFGTDDAYLVHGLDADAERVAEAREHIRSRGVYGQVSIEVFDGERLPYIDNLVNLLVVEDPDLVNEDELMRVLAPGGVAYVRREGAWKEMVKSRPDDIDEWTHYLHGPDNNPVAEDTVVGPPRHMQWQAGPRWSRHHDWLNSVSSTVTAEGRFFYILDEASAANLDLPGKWVIIARDAFSGVLLWRRPMESWAWHRHRFRSGPAQLPRLLVASGERLYVPLRLNGPVSALDAATGEVVHVYEETAGAEEIILAGNTLLVLTGAPAAEHTLTYPSVQERYGLPNEKTLLALNAETGETIWSRTPDAHPVPKTLASDGKRVYLRFDEDVACFDMQSGDELWRYAGAGSARKNPITYGQKTLIVADGVVLCNLGGNVVALSAQSGRELWAHETGTAFRAPVDIFAINSLMWHKLDHEMDPMRVPPDKREARDLNTGEPKLKDSVPEHLVTPGHHFRCYRAKATERFIIAGKRGVEMMDVDGDNHSRNNWVRGACQYGVLPANGLLYTPPHSCGCYGEAMLRGFWALAPEGREVRNQKPEERLEKGPAHEQTADKSQSEDPDDWPAYRHDPLRSGVATADVPAKLEKAWESELGGQLTQPVVSGGRVLVAEVDAGIVYALDEETGEVLWDHVAGGRVDSPPVIHKGMVLFGSADGRVTCLRLSDGELVWRFLAAPADSRAVASDRLESLWPVHGSVLVMDGVVYCLAGRSTWLDSGMYLYALDPASGKVLHRKRLKSQHPEYQEAENTEAIHVEGHLWTDYKTFSQPDHSDTFSIVGGVSDVLVSDGINVFIRHLMFNPELEELVGRSRQLFATSSLLDGEENHRADWGLGLGDHDRLPARRQKGGFSRFHLEEQDNPPPYRAGSPTGLMLVHQEKTVWGVERAGAFGDYELFKKEIESSPSEYVWREDLPVRPRAMLKSGQHLFLGVMPKKILDGDPHAAYEGRLGGAIWVYRKDDGNKIAEYLLPSPVVWDGMAAAGSRLYLTTTRGRLMVYGGASK